MYYNCIIWNQLSVLFTPFHTGVSFSIPIQPKCLIMPRRPLDWPEPSTYVPNMHRKIEPSDLPGPMVNRVGKPSFREYVMSKRSSNAPSVIEMPQVSSFLYMLSVDRLTFNNCSMWHTLL